MTKILRSWQYLPCADPFIAVMVQILTEDEEARFEQLCFACKTGNLELVESLVSNYAVPINREDRWQCVPFLCEFLLNNGAICDPHTFQGERCLYGALTDSVRQLLKKHRLTKGVSETRPFLAFMRQILAQADTGKSYPDLRIRFIEKQPAIESSGKKTAIWAHRVILAARSSWFDRVIVEHAKPIAKQDLPDDMSDNAWDLCFTVDEQEYYSKDKHPLLLPMVHLHCLQAALHYLYTGDTVVRPQSTLAGTAVPVGLQRMMLHFCEHIQLEELATAYRLELGLAIAKTTNKTAIVGATEEQTRQLQMDLENFYPAHRVFFCTRCDYVKTLLEGALVTFINEAVFYDTQTTKSNKYIFDLPALDSLGFENASEEVNTAVIQALFLFLYTDRCNISVYALHPTLVIADMLLLERLRALAAIGIATLPITTVDQVLQEAENQQTAFLLTTNTNPLDSLPFNIFTLYRQAAQWRLDRLEQWCVRWFASHLSYVASMPEFRQLVQDNVDSIVLIDEIRYWLQQYYKFEYINDDSDDDDADNDEDNTIITDNEVCNNTKKSEYLAELNEWRREYYEKVTMLEQVVSSLGLEA
ncbi:hypothetical protein BDF19DRAFT_431574 [Syncephalis fuscata]|nr:hypothetical protein BDF19DRAFT_431574 [Syncephalis fuscata]